MDPEEALTLEGSSGVMVQSGGGASASLAFKRVGGGSGTVRIGCKVRSDSKSCGLGVLDGLGFRVHHDVVMFYVFMQTRFFKGQKDSKLCGFGVLGFWSVWVEWFIFLHGGGEG